MHVEITAPTKLTSNSRSYKSNTLITKPILSFYFEFDSYKIHLNEEKKFPPLKEINFPLL